MLRTWVAAAAFCLATSAADKIVTWTGWFSDAHCAAARGTIAPTNPDCAATCIKKGEASVFISEQAKAFFTVKDYPNVIDDLGYHLEIQAKLDEEAKTIAIVKVTRLEYQGAACSRTKKPAQH